MTMGDRVLIHADNCPEMVLAWYACAVVGAVGVTTNTRSVQRRAGVLHRQDRLRRRHHPAVVRSRGGRRRARPGVDRGDRRRPRHPLRRERTELTVPLADRGAPRTHPTGPGTDGPGRDPVHLGHHVAAQGGRAHPCQRPVGRPGSARPTSPWSTTTPTWCSCPFFHVNAQSWSFWTTLGVGGTIVLQPKFSSSRFWEVVTEAPRHPPVADPLRVLGDRRPAHPRALGQGRGLRPDRARARGVAGVPGGAGLRHDRDGHPRHQRQPGPDGPQGVDGQAHARLRAADRGPGHRRGLSRDGRPGELWVRGTRGIQLFPEYYDNPEAMAKSFTAGRLVQDR